MDLYLSSSPAIAPSHSLVIVAGGGRDLLWLPAQIGAVLLARTSGQLVHGLLHGGARGADRTIGRAAFQLGWPVEVLPADWRRHGRAAGPIRNRELLELAISRAEALSSAAAPVSVLVVALPGGAGTASLVREARRLAACAPVPLSVAQISQAPTLP
ncbi:MAG: SLOG family protein [Cyanobacteria bacterium]|nr:SLOG family protein [Cyanobacteriota bacterium]